MTKENSIKIGDVFLLGNHRLACGDCRDKKLIAKLFAKEKAKLLCQDPPYGIAIVESRENFSSTKNKRKPIANDHLQSEEEYIRFTVDSLEAIKPFLERKNSVYIFNADKMIFALKIGMEKAGFKFTQLIIWVKNHSIIGRMDYLPQHELIAYGWFGQYDFLRSKDKSVLVFPRPSKSKAHPTMKPLGLLRRIILNSSKIGDVVFDWFGGSGQTLLACEQTQRRCFMIELDPEYCQTIIDRFEKMSGVKATRVIDKEKKDEREK